MRVAIVHDWITGMGGGERVLEALLTLFDDAEIFTLVHVPGSASPAIEQRRIHTSFIDGLPGAHTQHRSWLPLSPAAVERFDLHGFDLIVSSSQAVAKGAIAPPGVPHLCYCHTPMRYLWDPVDARTGAGTAAGGPGLLARPLARWLRLWDVETAQRIDRIVANSEYVRTRVARHWRRDAAVVHPPVDVARFQAATVRDEFYLIVAALLPHKRIDVAVEAFNRLGRRLVVVGDGSELPRLQNRADANIIFRGRLDDAEVADLMARCRAFVVPGAEDFGSAAVEAQAAGAPVVALGAGGALETVLPADDKRPAGEATGVFFDVCEPASLVAAVERIEKLRFDPSTLRRNAERFGPDRFADGMRAHVAALSTADVVRPGGSAHG